MSVAPLLPSPWTSDEFRFTYVPLIGDVDITARVSPTAAADAWSKAGLMIRSTPRSSSAHASIFVTGAHGAAFQRRAATEEESAATAGPPGVSSGWLTLERRNDVVTALYSPDNNLWTVIGS